MRASLFPHLNSRTFELIHPSASSGNSKGKAPEVSKAKPGKAPAKKAEKVEKTGWAGMSAGALKDKCREREISTGGNKADLVARLEEDDVERAIVNDPNYIPRRDENSITTGEDRLYPFQPRPDNDFNERCKKAVSLGTRVQLVAPRQIYGHCCIVEDSTNS